MFQCLWIEMVSVRQYYRRLTSRKQRSELNKTILPLKTVLKERFFITVKSHISSGNQKPTGSLSATCLHICVYYPRLSIDNESFSQRYNPNCVMFKHQGSPWPGRRCRFVVAPWCRGGALGILWEHPKPFPRSVSRSADLVSVQSSHVCSFWYPSGCFYSWVYP